MNFNVIQMRGRRSTIPDSRGPMARLRAVIVDPGAVEAIAKRIRKGDTLREIARSYAVPHRAFCDWFGQRIHDLAFAAQAQAPESELFI